jgi:hypothetical protein
MKMVYTKCKFCGAQNIHTRGEVHFSSDAVLDDVAEIKECVNLIRGYILLLNNELNEVCGIASVHGWKSTRYEQGGKMREKLLKYSERFGNVV